MDVQVQVICFHQHFHQPHTGLIGSTSQRWAESVEWRIQKARSCRTSCKVQAPVELEACWNQRRRRKRRRGKKTSCAYDRPHYATLTSWQVFFIQRGRVTRCFSSSAANERAVISCSEKCGVYLFVCSELRRRETMKGHGVSCQVGGCVCVWRG